MLLCSYSDSLLDVKQVFLPLHKYSKAEGNSLSLQLFVKLSKFIERMEDFLQKLFSA